jgi:hypothetical protein
LSSDGFSFSLLRIGDKRLWVHLGLNGSSSLVISHVLIEFSDSSFVSLEFLWPLGLSGSSEFSFFSSNRFLVVNPIFSKLFVGFNIVHLGGRVVIDNGILVINLEVKVSVSRFCDMDVFLFIFETSSPFSVDSLLFVNVSLNVLFESGSLLSGIVGEINDIANDGLIEFSSFMPCDIEVFLLDSF